MYRTVVSSAIIGLLYCNILKKLFFKTEATTQLACRRDQQQDRDSWLLKARTYPLSTIKTMLRSSVFLKIKIDQFTTQKVRYLSMLSLLHCERFKREIYYTRCIRLIQRRQLTETAEASQLFTIKTMARWCSG